MNFKPYQHHTQYYETDQMKIIHHSNYIRWFESARIDFLDQMGLSYAEMERRGISIPVLSIAAEYKTMVKFGDSVLINVIIETYNGVKLALSYTVKDSITNELRTTGTSLHCFMNDAGKPLSLRRVAPEIHEKFQLLVQKK